MPSQGPNNGSVFANDSSNGSANAWNNLTNAQISDGFSADATIVTGTSQWLTITDMGFQIPNATIDGIVWEIQRRRKTVGGGNIGDHSVKLIVDGVISGTDHALAALWTTSYAYFSYPASGTADLWGLTPYPSQINAVNYGLAIYVDADSGNPATAQIDHVRGTVYYTQFTRNNYGGIVNRRLSMTRTAKVMN